MKAGDKVETIDDAIKGIVKRVENGFVQIVTADDFEMTYRREELVIVSDFLEKNDLFPTNIRSVLSEKEINKPGKSRKVKPKERKLPPMEVDLHIDKLVEQTAHLTNHDMLTIQLDTAKRQLDFAISKKIQRIVFIHGVGDGVLRAELEYLFRRYDNVKYYDADFKKYARGATEVYIMQNTAP